MFNEIVNNTGQFSQSGKYITERIERRERVRGVLHMGQEVDGIRAMDV